MPVALQASAVQVPVRDVVFRLAHNGELREKPRDQVKPALVDEVAPDRIDAAVFDQPFAPPVEQAVDVVSGRERQVAEVVDARNHDVDLTRAPTVEWDRLVIVRDQHNPVLGGESIEPGQRAVDHDVWIQVGDRRACGVQQMPQQPGLDRCTELEHGVARRHRLERFAADVWRREDLERFLRGIDVAVELVDDQGPATRLRVCGEQRACEHPRMGNVVLGDDRADVQSPRQASSRRSGENRLSHPLLLSRR